MLFFSALATALVADVQIITSKDGISGIIRTVMSAPAHVRPNAPITIGASGDLRIAPRIQRTYQMPRREEPGDVAASLTDQVIAMFYQEMGDLFGEEMTFTQEEFVEMVNDSTVKDYIVDKTASLITDYFNGEVTTTFEPEEVVQLIQENSALIESITGAPIPDDIAEQVAKAFDENEIVVIVEKEGLAGFMKLMNNGENAGGDADSEDSNNFDVLENESNPLQIIKLLPQIGAIQNIIIGIAVCVILMAAIILINCRQLGKGLRRAGYPLIFVGAGYFILDAFLIGFLSNFLGTLATADPSLTMIATLVPKLFRYILDKTAVVSIVIFSVGCALFVGGIVLSIVLRAKKSPVSVPTTPEAEELAAAVADETPVEVLPETEEEPVAEETEDAPAPIGE